MEFLTRVGETIVAIHMNAAISIWGFLVENITMLFVSMVVAYIFVEDVKSHRYEFLQDHRKVM